MSTSSILLDGRKKQVFDFVVAYMRDSCGRSPTSREIEAETGIPLSVVNYHLNGMCKDGVLGKHDDGSRNLFVPGSRWVYDVTQ